MRSRLLSRAALLATALLAFFGAISASTAQTNDWIWEHTWVNDNANSWLQTTWTNGWDDDTEGDEYTPSEYVAGVQSLHYLSGYVDGGVGATAEGGQDGGDGYCEVYSYCAGIGELSPDEQPLISWGSIHDQIAYTEAEGGGGGGGGYSMTGGTGSSGQTAVNANQLSTGIACFADLDVGPSGNPTATVPGTIEVDFAWADVTTLDPETPGINTTDAWARDASFTLTADDATMTIANNGSDQLIAICQTNDPPPGGNTNTVIVTCNGFLAGASGDLFVGRGNCVDNSMSVGADASISGGMVSTFAGQGNAGPGFGGSPTSVGSTTGDGGGGAGGQGGPGGFSGGAADHASYHTTGTFQCWLGVFADW